MPLMQVKWEIVKQKEGERMGFKFTKYKHSFQLFIGSNPSNEQYTSLFNRWKSIFCKKCINVDFHNIFFVKKLIGKGSFGRVNWWLILVANLLKVYMAENKKTKQAFAIKGFTKDSILRQKRGKVEYYQTWILI